MQIEGQVLLRLQRLGIDIVGGCQLRCVGCPNSTLPHPIRFMSPDTFSRILGNVNVGHVEYLKLYNFGEIMLHNDLLEMVVQIPKQRFSVRHVEISTNGQCINKDLEGVIGSNIITRFGVSVDGDCTPEEYERLRPPGKWDKLCEFLRFVQMYGIKKTRTEFFLKVICTDKASEPKWTSFAARFGAKVEFRKWRKAADSIMFQGFNVNARTGPCKHVESTRIRCYVDWNGDVVPCCCHPRASVFGNLKEQKFSEIYKGKDRESFIRLMRRHRKEHKICGKCEVK